MSSATIASQASTDERATFLVKTYAHLVGAIVAFVAVETAVFKFTDLPIEVLRLLARSQYYWLAVLGLFMLGGFIADRFANHKSSPALQYFGLGLYVILEAAIFLPLLAIAVYFANDPNILPTAALTTLAIFGGLTAVVFITRKDFSFLRGILGLGMIIALALIVASIVFGFELGIIFTIAMIGLAAGYILYYTSNVLHHYQTDQHVAAALALFSAVMLLFWYVLRLFLNRS